MKIKNLNKKNIAPVLILVFALLITFSLTKTSLAAVASCTVSGGFSPDKVTPGSPSDFSWSSSGVNGTTVHITCSGGINSNGDYALNGGPATRYSNSDIDCTLTGLDNAGQTCTGTAHLTVATPPPPPPPEPPPGSTGLGCIPASNSIAIGASVRIDAKSIIPVSPIYITDWTGGTVSWSAPGGNPSTGSGNSFTTSFSTAGIKTVTVTSAVTATSASQTNYCPVTVGTPPPPPPPPPAAGNKFIIGDRVQATVDLHVRASPGITGTLRATVTQGSKGTVVTPPTNANPQNVTGTNWWFVQWDRPISAAPLSGWSSENLLAKASGGAPPTTSITVPVSTAGIVSITSVNPIYNGKYVLQKTDFGFLWLDTTSLQNGLVMAESKCIPGLAPSNSGIYVTGDCWSAGTVHSFGNEVIVQQLNGQCGAATLQCGGPRTQGAGNLHFQLGTWQFTGLKDVNEETVTDSTQFTDLQGRTWRVSVDPAYPAAGPGCCQHFIWTSSGGTTPPTGQHLACVSSSCTLVSGGGGNLDGCVNAGTTCVATPPPTTLTCAQQYPGNLLHQSLCEQVKSLQIILCLLAPGPATCGSGGPPPPPPPPPPPSSAPVAVDAKGATSIIGIPPKYYGQNGRYVIQHSEFGFFWLDTATLTGGHVQSVSHCGGLGSMPNSDSRRWVIADCNGTTDDYLSGDGTQVVTVMTSGQCGAQRYPSCSGSRDDGHWAFAFGLGTWDYKGDYTADPSTLIDSSPGTADPQGRHWKLIPDSAYPAALSRYFLWTQVP